MKAFLACLALAVACVAQADSTAEYTVLHAEIYESLGLRRFSEPPAITRPGRAGAAGR